MQDEVISLLLTHCDCDKSLTTTITWCWEGFSSIKLNKACVLHLVADLNVKAFHFFANTAVVASYVQSLLQRGAETWEEEEAITVYIIQRGVGGGSGCKWLIK